MFSLASDYVGEACPASFYYTLILCNLGPFYKHLADSFCFQSSNLTAFCIRACANDALPTISSLYFPKAVSR